MKKIILGVTLLAVCTMGAAMVWTQEKGTIENLPPVVIKTYPVSGTLDVDPNIKQIRVSFSKEMADKTWSWCNMGGFESPKPAGGIFYEKDQRTCVCPVQLEAGKDYVIWLNTGKFQNFKDKSGRSSIPYLLCFRTKAAAK